MWLDWYKKPPKNDRTRIIVVVIQNTIINVTTRRQFNEYTYELVNIIKGKRIPYSNDKMSYSEKAIKWCELPKSIWKRQKVFSYSCNCSGMQ